MAGCGFFPLRFSRNSRACVGVVIFLALLFSTLPGYAQLPGGKPKEFAPVIPDFESLSADWWKGWTQAELEQRQQWLDAVEKAWGEWRATLPDNEQLVAQEKVISQRIQGIRSTWQRRRELQKIPVLPKAKFPDDPDVLQWAESDAAVARGHQRLSGLQLELRQLEESSAQALNQLRQQVIVLRDSSGDKAERERASIALFAAQLGYLQILGQREMLNRQLTTWQEEIDHAENELTRMLREMHFSEEAGEQLRKSIEQQRKDIAAISAHRADLPTAILEGSDPATNMERELSAMALDASSLAAQLQLRKQELLNAMNSVLSREGKRSPLILSGDLVENARKLTDSISRELNLRQRQVVAWVGEDSQAMGRWWRAFERVDSGVGRTDDLIGDVLRYETAQLQLYRQRQGWWATARERAVHWQELARDHWRDLADYNLFVIAESPITPRDLTRIALTLLFAWLISLFTRRFLNRLVRKKHASESSMYNLGRLLHYLIIAIAFVIIFAMLGLDTTKLALVAGALSVGIGFGMQAIFSNFISGLILLFEQPLRVGDLVELESGVFGRIREINVRSTRITTRDNVDILVPNSEFIAGRVTNHTLDDPVRRIHVSFGVAYDSDPDLVHEAALAAAERVSITHSDWQRKTEVWLDEFGDNALNFKLVVWINSNMVSLLGDAHALYNLELLRELRHRDIEVPFPQRDLHLRSVQVPLEIIQRKEQ